jgi:hypothetical protein
LRESDVGRRVVSDEENGWHRVFDRVSWNTPS